MFLERATQRWWTLVVRGILSIAFGALTVAAPPAAVMAMVFIFGIYAIVDGLTALSVLLSPLAPERGAALKWMHTKMALRYEFAIATRVPNGTKTSLSLVITTR